jgi:hypothetical protein
MSMPYFIHKDDLDMYQAFRKEHGELVKLVQVEIDKLTAEDPLEWVKAEWAVSNSFSVQFDLLNKKYPYRYKTMFDAFNEKDWVAHFLGWPMDKAFGEAMLGVAEKGIDDCTKVIKGIK